MSGDVAAPRPRLVSVDGVQMDRSSAVEALPEPHTPRVAIVPVECDQSAAVSEFAFELARALAAQTARTGAVVIADRAALPGRSRFRRSAKRLGPLTGLRVDPLLEREGVLFFDPAVAPAVRAAARGQMPEVTITSSPEAREGGDRSLGASAFVLVTSGDARAEYVELLRGELAEAEHHRPVFVLEIAAGAKRGSSLVRSRAWALAAELVLER